MDFTRGTNLILKLPKDPIKTYKLCDILEENIVEVDSEKGLIEVKRRACSKNLPLLRQYNVPWFRWWTIGNPDVWSNDYRLSGCLKLSSGIDYYEFQKAVFKRSGTAVYTFNDGEIVLEKDLRERHIDKLQHTDLACLIDWGFLDEVNETTFKYLHTKYSLYYYSRG